MERYALRHVTHPPPRTVARTWTEAGVGGEEYQARLSLSTAK